MAFRLPTGLLAMLTMAKADESSTSLSINMEEWGNDSGILFGEDKDGSARSHNSSSTSLTMNNTAAKRAEKIRRAHAHRQAGLRRQRSTATDDGSQASNPNPLGVMRTAVGEKKKIELPKNPPRRSPPSTRRTRSSKSCRSRKTV